MKRYFPWIVLVLAILSLASSWRMPKLAPGDFDYVKFGKIPVLADGRLKPLDTVGRNALVILRGRQTVRLENGTTLSATHWLADVMFHAPEASQYPVFAINNPDVLGLFGWEQGERKYFSYTELEPFFQKIDEQGQQAEGNEAAQRSPYQTAIYNLRNALIVYQRLQQGLRLEGFLEFTTPDELVLYQQMKQSLRVDGKDAAPERNEKQISPTATEVTVAPAFATEVAIFDKLLPMALPLKDKSGVPTAEEKTKLALLDQFTHRYQSLAEMSSLLAVPPRNGEGEWLSIGASLLQSPAVDGVNPVVKTYAAMGDAFRANKADVFNRQVDDLAAWMTVHEPATAGRASFEYLFNHIAPFYQSMTLYVLVFLLVCASWIGWSQPLNRAAFLVTLLALVLHTFGLAARMYLQGRPPVTNLYSSAIFIGWGTVLIGLFMERMFRDGIGLACSSVIGFVTLIIAHHLAATGDTLEMLRAVLDTNIWLATHVVTITLGYSAMFLAGVLAMFYVIRGVFSRSLTRESAQSLARMTYGVICFAALFSFVGTVLGGIWADQAWGRFWGWDPKENGALLIVLWCAIILHARLGGYIRQRGLMMMALFGNIITSFSWFGVNMLGVGLHSYGFMDKAFPWLMAFVVFHLALMAVTALPLNRWQSSQEK